MTFRFNAQKVFLTYSQVGKRFTPEVLLEAISAKAEVQDYLISQEEHADGGFHLHAYFKFTKKLDTKSQSFFDVPWYGKERHPNIQKPRSVHKIWDYIKKDKQYITNIQETRPVWKVLLDDAETEEEFLTGIMWQINRIDNYAGYKTLRDLRDLKTGHRENRVALKKKPEESEMVAHLRKKLKR